MFQQIINNSGGKGYLKKYKSHWIIKGQLWQWQSKLNSCVSQNLDIWYKCITTTLIMQLTVPLSIKSWLKSDNILPQLSQLLTLQNNPEVMTLFCNHFLACVTGKMIENDKQRKIWSENLLPSLVKLLPCWFLKHM